LGLNASIYCDECNSVYSVKEPIVLCPCGKGLAEVRFDSIPKLSWDVFSGRNPGVWKYLELIPVPPEADLVSIGEGGTPLVKLKNGPTRNSYVKLEGSNPTGSFKDRGMTVAITMAKYLGVKTVICASTGNTSSSMAAYAARAGLKAVIVLPEGKVAKGKISQAILHGATIINVKGNFDQALSVVREIGRKGIAYVMNSVNPWRLEGQKTVGFEIVEEIGVPDWIVLPVGNAGNISALWKGLKELAEAGLIDKPPRIAGIQALGASPLAQAFKNNRKTPEFIDNPETIASAIRIGKPVSWKRAMKAVEESGGVFESVTDREILEAQKNLARKEGLGVEPASAAAYAGAMKLVESSIIDKDDKIAIIATGHALKDPDIAGSHEVVKYSADPESIESIILNITSK